MSTYWLHNWDTPTTEHVTQMDIPTSCLPTWLHNWDTPTTEHVTQMDTPTSCLPTWLHNWNTPTYWTCDSNGHTHLMPTYWLHNSGTHPLTEHMTRLPCHNFLPKIEHIIVCVLSTNPTKSVKSQTWYPPTHTADVLQVYMSNSLLQQLGGKTMSSSILNSRITACILMHLGSLALT